MKPDTSTNPRAIVIKEYWLVIKFTIFSKIWEFCGYCSDLMEIVSVFGLCDTFVNVMFYL